MKANAFYLHVEKSLLILKCKSENSNTQTHTPIHTGKKYTGKGNCIYDKMLVIYFVSSLWKGYLKVLTSLMSAIEVSVFSTESTDEGTG